MVQKIADNNGCLALKKRFSLFNRCDYRPFDVIKNERFLTVFEAGEKIFKKRGTLGIKIGGFWWMFEAGKNYCFPAI